MILPRKRGLARVNILPSSQIILNNTTSTIPTSSWESTVGAVQFALHGLLVDLKKFPDFDEATRIYANS